MATFGIGGGGDLQNVSSHIVPATDVLYNIGTPLKKWNNLYAVNFKDELDVTAIQISSTTRRLVNAAGTWVLDFTGSNINLNGVKITGLATPTAPSDAATKAYADSAAGANAALSNLTATSINQHLVPNANNTLDLGSTSPTQLRWRNLFFSNAVATESGYFAWAFNWANLMGPVALPSGASVSAAMRYGNNNTALGIFTSTANDAITRTSHIRIETGNNSLAGGSGHISVTTGTSPDRGEISLTASQINVNSTKIVNLATPTAATDAANKSYVDSLVGGGSGQFNGVILTGSVSWQAPSGVTRIKVYVQGGGGGGAAAFSSDPEENGCGGGGGGTAFSIVTVIPGNFYPVGVGGGGAAGGGGGSGQNGFQSHFNNTIYGYGGAGGQASNPSINGAAGGGFAGGNLGGHTGGDGMTRGFTGMGGGSFFSGTSYQSAGGAYGAGGASLVGGQFAYGGAQGCVVIEYIN